MSSRLNTKLWISCGKHVGCSPTYFPALSGHHLLVPFCEGTVWCGKPIDHLPRETKDFPMKTMELPRVTMDFPKETVAFPHLSVNVSPSPDGSPRPERHPHRTYSKGRPWLNAFKIKKIKDLNLCKCISCFWLFIYRHVYDMYIYIYSVCVCVPACAYNVQDVHLHNYGKYIMISLARLCAS